jgi:thiamine transport system substrate-binding protein
MGWSPTSVGGDGLRKHPYYLIRVMPAEGTMMRTRQFIAIFLLVGGLFAANSPVWAQANAQPNPAGAELVIWTYDSFMSEWGPAGQIAEAFQKAYGAKLRFVSKGDGGALLSALLDGTKKPNADIIIGLDNRQLEKALQSGVFVPLSLKNLADVQKNLLLDPTNRLVPYDFGQFAFMWDSQSGVEPPRSLEDLTKPLYRKKIIIMDPRTSTPGLGFLAWTEAAYKEGWKNYWKRLSPSILTMTPSWDTGYGLFTKGEAPLALSYSTDPAYHKAYENTERYKALQFTEGHPMQIEFAGVLVSSPNRELAQKFVDFLLSAECQAFLPETQWMFPSNTKAKLPASFSVVSKYPALNAEVGDIDRDPSEAANILISSP